MSNIALIFGSSGHKFSKNICPSFRLAGYLYKFFSLSLSSMAPWPYLARAVFLLYDSHVLKSFYIFVEKLQPVVGKHTRVLQKDVWLLSSCRCREVRSLIKFWNVDFCNQLVILRLLWSKAIRDGDGSGQGEEDGDHEEELEAAGGRPRRARHREDHRDDGRSLQLQRVWRSLGWDQRWQVHLLRQSFWNLKWLSATILAFNMPGCTCYHLFWIPIPQLLLENKICVLEVVFWSVTYIKS